MVKVSIHLIDGEVVSLDDVTSIITTYKAKTTSYTGDEIVKVPVRNSFAYFFESAARKLNISGEQIKYVEFPSH